MRRDDCRRLGVAGNRLSDWIEVAQIDVAKSERLLDAIRRFGGCESMLVCQRRYERGQRRYHSPGPGGNQAVGGEQACRGIDAAEGDPLALGVVERAVGVDIEGEGDFKLKGTCGVRDGLRLRRTQQAIEIRVKEHRAADRVAAHDFRATSRKRRDELAQEDVRRITERIRRILYRTE